MRYSCIAVLALAFTQLAATTREGGYEINRWQTAVNAPAGKVGRKTTDYETREGIAPETDGNSSKMVMRNGGYVKECPNAQGIVEGDFEYALTLDEVNTDEVPTLRRHFEKGIVATLKGQVFSDARLQHVDLKGKFRRGDGSPPQDVSIRFTLDSSGMPDFEAMKKAVEMTGDMSTAIAIWFSATNYRDAEQIWTKVNRCVEVAFDPASNTRELAPGESLEVATTLRTFDNLATVAEAKLDATALGGATVTPRSGRTEDSAPVTFKYTAPPVRQLPRGFDVTAISRAGVATGEWRALDGLKLAIEHRLLSRRDTPHAKVGRPLYDGTVRFELRLEPFPTLPGEFRGETTVVRQFSVGHITPRCTGQGSQTENWRVNATVDARSGTMKLGLAMFSDELDAFWVCDGQRSEVTSPFRSALKLVETPLTMPSRSGSRQTFSPSGPMFQETLTVTIP